MERRRARARAPKILDSSSSGGGGKKRPSLAAHEGGGKRRRIPDPDPDPDPGPEEDEEEDPQKPHKPPPSTSRGRRPQAPIPGTVRIHIVHSFGRVTSHEVPRGARLEELFRLHHEAGGRAPERGVVMRQVGGEAAVGGGRYWVREEGEQAVEWEWGRVGGVKVEAAGWGFVDGVAWVACVRRREGEGEGEGEEVEEVEEEDDE